ncbi:MAG: DNA polymerase III subunit gamma/tau [Desulfomicrobium sp.]|nr:DNA polymerase III subunit gamma/tau [Pseudomonadota bacterium]MBV1711158.1 DNA polymerase III subunit gamma/tau [Desulfomicrobium sp.]MBU4569829.1 DNA polymerase III subunit gamma/tau [Pseudomonadota bacterium]MBU4594927.1 DNA polymerase III subunit gamma/tau [Pseudomonadota bacterium]MBV1718952.1 DNA polymerase III subunit gamma/tau [Desulfomicrobium sp.]
MSQESLTARYRPQSFAEVAGQDAVKRILSRAASIGRVAPAYLFSGTRGVGKTTLARIFAKALNCMNGPAAEPCNQCPICRQITLGVAVDVAEIDGASNTGVDNVRRLKEDVGYAPLECRYKVIIIDEAHMLSKQAFNALLKTLEEPPGHVTFIMATTEPEKFPQTIVSRCQHFVFKRLPQAELVRHLDGVLSREGVPAEPSAVTLIARRGAGSVRDGMSLLGQVMALGSDSLTLEDVREVLGLAGSEVFVKLIECVQSRDLQGLHALLMEILDQGVDLGFFLRELAGCWRNLFLLHQMGDAARSIIDLPAEEVDIWAAVAPGFSLGHLHAAWQMTMDSQRKVLTSMEPALALELLLLNLACLPDLLAMGAGQARPGGDPGQGEAPGRSAPPRPVTPPAASRAPGRAAPPPASASSTQARPAAQAVPAAQVEPARTGQQPSESSRVLSRSAATGSAAQAVAPGMSVREAQADFKSRGDGPSAVPPGSATQVPPAVQAAPAAQAVPVGPRDWSGFVVFCAKRGEGAKPLPALDKAQGELQGAELVVTSQHIFLCDRLKATMGALVDAARAYFGPGVAVRIETPVEAVRKTRTELREMAQADPVVQEAQERFQARIMEVRPFINGNSKESEI